MVSTAVHSLAWERTGGGRKAHPVLANRPPTPSSIVPCVAAVTCAVGRAGAVSEPCQESLDTTSQAGRRTGHHPRGCVAATPAVSSPQASPPSGSGVAQQRSSWLAFCRGPTTHALAPPPRVAASRVAAPCPSLGRWHALPRPCRDAAAPLAPSCACQLSAACRGRLARIACACLPCTRGVRVSATSGERGSR